MLSLNSSLICLTPILTLTQDFLKIRLDGPGGYIDQAGSVANLQRHSSPHHHQVAASGIRTSNSQSQDHETGALTTALPGR